ncbi:MAG: site-2 protease family protein [Clostridiales bacterium]|nr:site-2 protease family protein [Clostridiales bacterium]
MLSVFSSAGTIIVTILIFGLLITVHELGHYLVARLFKVGVREFSIGMGPKIKTWNGKHNKFSIRWFPIGGYVTMVGEDPDDEPEPEDIGKAGLNTKPIWQRALVVAAGPVMNILLAFLIMTVFVITAPVLGSTTITKFDKEAITYEAGLRVNDRIIEIDGSKVRVYNDLAYLIALRGKDPVDVRVIRDGKEVLIEDVQFPASVTNGIAMGDIDFYIDALDKTPGEVLYQSFYWPISIIDMTVESLIRTFKGEYGWEAVSGPIGVGEQVGDVIKHGAKFTDTIRNLALITVIISISLGICNLIPIPVLDGGHLLFFLIEAIRRKPINRKVHAVINAVFMILLLGFMAVIALKDILGLF